MHFNNYMYFLRIIVSLTSTFLTNNLLVLYNNLIILYKKL